MAVRISLRIRPEPLQLAFGRAELGALLLGVLIGTVISDGRGNWYRGVQLIVVYAAIAIMYYFVPDVPR